VGAGLIDQAVNLAATRYAQNQVLKGKADNASGLARWWLQENAAGARARAETLLTDYNLDLTQLADSLLAVDPPWLRHYRKPAAQETA
jgi:hypothetical protein